MQLGAIDVHIFHIQIGMIVDVYLDKKCMCRMV